MNDADRVIEEFLEAWELTPDGPPQQGETALTVPVWTRTGTAVLSVGDPGRGADEFEALALQTWHGRGAVRLIRANPRRRVLLLERLGDDLREHWDVQACELVGALMGTLHVPAPPQFALLSTYAGEVADRLAGLPRGVPLPPRLIDQARSLARAFAADEATDGRLIHTDLHYGTVRAVPGADHSAASGWRAVGPKPLNGDPHYEIAPLLIQRYEELAGRVREGIRDRFFAAIDAAGLDEQRAKDWVVVRMLDRAAQQIETQIEARIDQEWFTQCVAIAKAVQD